MGRLGSATPSSRPPARCRRVAGTHAVPSGLLNGGIALLLLVSAHRAAATISFVRTICSANAFTTGTTLACSPANGPVVAAGDLVVVSIAWTSNAGSLAARDDAVPPNGYTCYTNTVSGVTMRDAVCVSRLTTPLTAANTLTVTGPSGNARALLAFEFFGADPATALQGTNGGTSTGNLLLSGAVTSPPAEVLEFGSFAVRQDVQSTIFAAGARCSVTTGTTCTVNANCPAGEFCASFIALSRDGTTGQAFNRTIDSEYRTSHNGPETLQATGTIDANKDYAAQILVFAALPTPTPTATATATPTYTPTPTSTATPTVTATPTITGTPTVTPTATLGLCTALGLSNPCVPGGGAKTAACFFEWAPSPVPARKANLTPKSTLICYEGDPSCDSDGVPNNNSCTMQTRLCINNSDPRLPSCLRSDVTKFEVKSPRPSSTDPINQTNRQTLETQAGPTGYGVSVYRGATPIFAGTPNSGPDSCSPLLPIQVPLRVRSGRASASRRTLGIKITSSLGKIEYASLNLQCRKSTCGDGRIQSDHEQCDQGGGNRVNGDGCDAGCHVEPGWQCTGVPSVCTRLTPTPTNTSLPPTKTPTPTQTPTPPGPSATPSDTGTPTDTPTNGPSPTPTLIPVTCVLADGTSATLSAELVILRLPLSGSQVWRFGALQPDSTRSIAILPSESHFDCAGTTFSGEKVKICARVDPTTYCHGGPNDGLACPPAACGAGNPCDITPGSGAVDCAPSGGSITGYNNLVQIDHNTNQATVDGLPNIGLPADPNCTNTFVDPTGAVLSSCLEGTGAACTGPSHTHIGVCNSPAEETVSGVSPAGGFRLHETIDLAFVTGADCTTPCPLDNTPLQPGELQLAGDITSGQTKGVVWQVNDTAAIMGTTGVGNGANICGLASGGPVCSTVATGTPIDLSAMGGDCLGAPTNVPITVSGAAVALAYPTIDIDPTVGDFVATLRLQCQ